MATPNRTNGSFNQPHATARRSPTEVRCGDGGREESWQGVRKRAPATPAGDSFATRHPRFSRATRRPRPNLPGIAEKLMKNLTRIMFLALAVLLPTS